MFKISLVLFLVPSLAVAQVSCGKRDVMIAKLEDKYKEQQVSIGLGNNSIIETWASEDTGTFTIMMSYSNGVSCLVATGTNFFMSSEYSEKESGEDG